MSFIEHNHNGLVYMTAPNISARHAFSTRYGGVSAGGLASLNLGYNRGDAPENVTENYRRLGAALGFDALNAAFTSQVHGNVVLTVTDENRAHPRDSKPIDCDGLVTNVPGLPIFCFTADCVPVLLHDPVAGVAAALHCGWRSSVADILGAALGQMSALGSLPADIRAALGPAIGACCFETDSDVPEAVAAYLGGDTAGLISPGAQRGKYLVDLRLANARRLTQLGVSAENIAISDECTMCKPQKYWSHRVAKNCERGSQCAVIML